MTQKQRTVLLIDDSPEDRETYGRYLLQDTDYSYTILEAAFGEEGLELCERTQIDGVLLDYLLPDLDGLEFLVELQKRMTGNHPPVIMVTTEGDEAIAVQAIKSGCFDYLLNGTLNFAYVAGLQKSSEFLDGKLKRSSVKSLLIGSLFLKRI